MNELNKRIDSSKKLPEINFILKKYMIFSVRKKGIFSIFYTSLSKSQSGKHQ